MAGHAFVTHHAIEQFQQRIADLPDNRALGEIITGVEQGLGGADLPPGAFELRLRTCGVWRFTAVLKCDGVGVPAVVTVFPRGEDPYHRADRRRHASNYARNHPRRRKDD